MAAPGKYTPSFSFSGYQATQPDRPLPGPRHDTEYFNIAYSLGQTIDALNDIRRDDGKLENGIVDWESLAPGLGDSIYPDAPQDGLIYGRTNATWAPVTIVHVGDNPPGALRAGDLFWELDAGGLFINYFDGDSTQLVEIAGPAMNAAADAAAARAEAAAEAAENAASQAEGAVSDAVSASNVPIFSTVQALLAYSVNPGLTAIRVNGYEAVGDGGAAFYVKKGSAPAHAGKFQSGDGAWWELDEDYVKPEMFGAEGNGVADDTAALVAASSAAVGIKAELLFTGKYYATANTTITPRVHFSEYGGLKAASGITVTLAGGVEVPPKAHVFDISAGGFIWPTKQSTISQYNYGAVSSELADYDDTAALQATIDANLYFMQSDRIRFLAGSHLTTKPLMVNYGPALRQISIEGPGSKYSNTTAFVGLRIYSDHWGNCIEVNSTRKCTISGIMFYGPFLEQIRTRCYGTTGPDYSPLNDPYLIESWIPKASETPTNPQLPHAGPNAPKGILGRFRIPAAIAIDPRAGTKPVPVFTTTPVRFVAMSGDIATDFENGDSFDGLTLATGDRFLYANPIDPQGDMGHQNNGVWVVQASGTAVRATDMDTSAEFTNAAVTVTAGSKAGTQWVCNTRLPLLNGIQPIVFWEFDGQIAHDDYAYPPYSDVVTQYGQGLSSDVTVNDCNIRGFAAGVTIQACDADGNGDFMKMFDCNGSQNIFTFTWGNTQARNTAVTNCAFSFSRVHFSTGIVGRQFGKPMLYADSTHVANCLDIVDMPTGDLGGGCTLVNCFGEVVNRIGRCFSSASAAGGFSIIGGQYTCNAQRNSWWRVPNYMIYAGRNGVSLLGGVNISSSEIPLIIKADPANCVVEAHHGLSAWMTKTVGPASVPVAEAIAHHSTMDVMFLDANQGPWQGRGTCGAMFSITTGAGEGSKIFGVHSSSGVIEPIPFCARTAGGSAGLPGVSVALGMATFSHSLGGAVLTSPSQAADILTITLNAVPTAGEAFQKGFVKGSIVFDVIATNLFLVTNLVGAVMTLRQLNNLDKLYAPLNPSKAGNSFFFTPTGHYSPNNGLEITYVSGSPTATFVRPSDGATSDNAQLPVGAARAFTLPTPLSYTNSAITASSAGSITFAGNARLSLTEQAGLFFVPRP